MATAMNRTDAPVGETIDEGSSGRLGPPLALIDGSPTTNGVGVVSGPTTSQRVEVAAGTVRIEIVITADPARRRSRCTEARTASPRSWSAPGRIPTTTTAPATTRSSWARTCRCPPSRRHPCWPSSPTAAMS